MDEDASVEGADVDFEGHLTEHHRLMLQLLCKQLAQQEELIAELDRKIEEQTRPFVSEIDRLDAVPGGRSPRGRGRVGGNRNGHEAFPDT